MNFLKIRFKNILSFGNKLTELDLDSNSVVCIYGENGAGKTTVLEAIYFCLTGKPFRNIKKNDLINKINKKGLYTELEFEYKGSKFLIKRGIKPNIFEVHKNGELLDQDSNIRDYQKVLEDSLGLTDKYISQTMIMSARNYTPFLKLTAADKRKFFDNLLSIETISAIVELSKKKIQLTQSDEIVTKKDVEIIQTKIESAEEYNEKIKQHLEEQRERIKEKAKDIKKTLEENEKKIEEKMIEAEKIDEKHQELKENYKKREKFDRQLSEINTEIRIIKNNLKFISENTSCEYCKQEISDNHKSTMKEEFDSNLKNLNKKIVEINKVLEKFEKIHQKMKEVYDKYFDMITEIGNIKSQNSNLTRQKQELVNEYNDIAKKNIEDIDETLYKKKNELQDKLDLLTQTKNDITILQKLLSEKGIRKFIFDKYTPILNKFINDYLTILDAPYRLTFDETMTEKIISRGYDELGYDSFSDGEKQRCDMALLFSFLEIARMKNATESNLICFDEMFFSMDTDGVRGIDKIFAKLKERGYTVLLIEHRADIREIADERYKVVKNNFSNLGAD